MFVAGIQKMGEVRPNQPQKKVPRPKSTAAAGGDEPQKSSGDHIQGQTGNPAGDGDA
jgi:hypothetical protein